MRAKNICKRLRTPGSFKADVMGVTAYGRFALKVSLKRRICSPKFQANGMER